MSDCQILIVDDEDFMRGAVLEVLRRANHVAMTAYVFWWLYCLALRIRVLTGW